tara:strand:- start:4032 stop:5018 length:987 start_codon:yes stop_codon:yes gene_type:complete
MSHFRIFLLTLSFLGLFNTVWADEAKSEPVTVNGIVAAVEEDHLITLAELSKEMEPFARQMRMEINNPEELQGRMNALRKEVLQNLIDRILIVKEFEKSGFRLPQSYLENEYDEHITKNFNGDRSRFIDHLQSQGMTVRQFRKDLRENIIVSIMRSRNHRAMSEISPNKIERYYKENQHQFLLDERAMLHQIMLTQQNGEEDSTFEQRVQKVMQALDAGHDFIELSEMLNKEEAKGASISSGWINRSDLRPELSKPAFTQELNTHSKPIAMGKTVFILYPTQREDAGVEPLIDVRKQIEILLSSKLAQQAHKKWLDRLRKDAYVKYFL